jgi:hypothetical protein
LIIPDGSIKTYCFLISPEKNGSLKSQALMQRENGFPSRQKYRLKNYAMLWHGMVPEPRAAAGIFLNQG